MNVLGLDVGGANLKAADSEGRAITRPFAVWKEPQRLAEQIGSLVAAFSRPELIAVTMTAELAECFPTKREGVCSILAAVQRAAGAVPIRIWDVTGRLVDPQQACDEPLSVAAANWHALATFAGRFAPHGGAVLIDVGTTTTDIIPLRDGTPISAGRTDRDRLQSGELVYTGYRRTPLCAVAASVAFRGRPCPLAAEVFATTLDVYLTLGDLQEDQSDRETADGRAATGAAARDRLARSVCSDREDFTAQDAVLVAHELADAQSRQIERGLRAVLDAQSAPTRCVIVAGKGDFLANRVLSRCAELAGAERISFATLFDPSVGEAACAYALARLASSMGGPLLIPSR